MPLRDLLCILEATENPSNAALDQALALARGHGAHTTVLIAGPKVAPPRATFTVGLVTGLAQAENEKILARAEKLAADARAALAAAKVEGEAVICLEFFQAALAAVRARALCSDLVVMGRPGGVIERSEVMFEEMLFGAGRPVLVAVPDRAPVEKARKIALAWDGSPHAARSLAVALAFFPDVKEADVMVVTGDKDLSEAAPAAGIAAHIGRYGIKANVVERAADKKGAAAAIDAHASKANCDLIVMGGFGRSRLRQFVLGGVTRELTLRARTPLLLVH